MNNSIPTDTSEAGRLATARSGMYGFLVKIYREPPTAEFLLQLTDPLFHTALSNLGIDLTLDLMARPDEHLLQDLAVEFTALFVGPGKHISPHESVYEKNEGGGLWGRSTADVKCFIERCGYNYRLEYKGLPDHISVEFEFMSNIIRQEANAWRTQNRRLIDVMRPLQQKFLLEHLLNWIPHFCGEVVEAAELPFYREMALLTNQFLEFEFVEQSKWPLIQDNKSLKSSKSFLESASAQAIASSGTVI